ncbi:PAS domain-containing protein [Hymenobacter sp. HMF4947]|uniref:histidine kinase n=1 Tax=Hymenobacter ginkgonis TaxID=2682976 RepID=A0A7K1TKB7_9BACT|nr:PAS domain-containing protein [Hymenobacter ginkgonis]MVN78813.1 PAS domain-containing protein [Hymenobacter ginkgonis]
MSAHTPAHPAPMPASEDLLEVLFNVSMTGVILFRPVFAADGAEIVDLAYVRLNTAAQQMLQLPERPEQSFLTLYPTARPTGVFDFYCQAFQAATVKRHQFNYQHDGLDAYFYLAAQRSGEVLVVSFTDTNEQPRSAVEEALRASQVREQAALAAAEARQATLYAMFEQAPVAISLLQGPTHVIEFANARMAQLWDRSLAQVAGQAHFTALPELAGQGFEDILGAVWRTGEPHYLQEQFVSLRRAGQPYQGYFNITYQPSYDGQGQRTGVLTSAIDVTEQVLARQQVEQLNQQLEAARAEAERERNQLQALIAQAPVAIALFEGEDLHVTSVNAVISALWGHTPAQVLGRPLLEGVPELQGQGFDDLLRQVLHTQAPYTGTEIPATLRRGGQLHTTYFNFVYQPLYEVEGQVTGVLCVAVDVTEQVVARQQVQTLNEELAAINEELRASNEEYQLANVALIKSQQQLRQLTHELEARVQQRTAEAVQARLSTEHQRQRLERLLWEAPAAVAIIGGPELVFEFFNPLYAAMFAGRPQIGLSILDAMPELRGQEALRTLRQVYETGQTHQETSILVPLARPADGHLEDRYFDYVQQARFNEQGQVDGALVFAFEVTRQLLAQQQVQILNQELTVTNEELNESNTRLTRTNVDLDTFVYTASHDLKAPITNIESITLALRETLPPAVQQDKLVAHLLDLLTQTTARFQFTIGQLTDISRLQLVHAGPAEPVHLAAVVEAVRLDLTPLIAAAGAQLTVEVAPELVVSFSPANLRSAIYNLLSNAVKYRASDRPCQIRVHAARTGQRVVLTVQDNGLGMSEVQQRQLFGLFQRLHTHVEGTGVGLYITKRLVENGGGTIAVESQVDRGTTFTLTFPA